MDLALTEIQSMLVSSAREFLEKECPIELVRETRASDTGLSAPLWRKAASLGWAGLAIDECYGGSGLGVFELLLLAEECGRALAPIPLISTALLCAPAIQEHGSEEQRQRYLPRMASGECIAAFAYTEPSASYDPEGICATASPEGGQYLLNGTKLFVRDGFIADLLLVAARTGADPRSLTVFLVDLPKPGLERTPVKTIDGDRQAEIQLNGVRVEKESVLGRLNCGWPIIEAVIERGVIAECASLAGVCQEALSRTVAYASQRVQFGRPIGSFQAIQHMCADMAVATDGIRYSTYMAGSMLASGSNARREISQAKVWASDAAAKVLRDAHQIHAGIAFIKDHDLHYYYDRAKGGDLYFGISEWHRERVASMLLD